MRFSEWVKADKIRQEGQNRDQFQGQSRRISPNLEGPREGFLRNTEKTQLSTEMEELKECQMGNQKEKNRSSLNWSLFK